MTGEEVEDIPCDSYERDQFGRLGKLGCFDPTEVGLLSPMRDYFVLLSLWRTTAAYCPLTGSSHSQSLSRMPLTHQDFSCINTCTKGVSPGRVGTAQDRHSQMRRKDRNPTQITHKPDAANFGAIART